MRCIECNSSLVHHHLVQKLRHNAIAKRDTNVSWLFCGKSISRLDQRRQHGIVAQALPLNVEAFHSSITLGDVVAPRGDTKVLIQTSVLLIVVYLIANFVVPQFISKSLGLDKVDESEKPSDTKTRNK